MAQLREGGPRDHAADLAEAGIGPYTTGPTAETQPDAAAGVLNGAGQGAIVNQLARNTCDAAQALQRGSADQDAASGSGGDAMAAPRMEAFARTAGEFDPGRRIQHEEEKHEGGD